MTATPVPMTSKKAASEAAVPLPAVLRQLGEVLTRQAALMIDMIIPGASRVYRPAVLLSNEETASTNGSLWIRMPLDFLGLNFPSKRVEAAPIWLGLLAHEFGHWLQPLKEVDTVAEELHVPHWFVNILLDIHGEALVAGLFPALTVPLTAQRSHIASRMANEYKTQLKAADNFLDALQVYALYYRFCSRPSRSWGYYTPSPRQPAPDGVPHKVGQRIRSCADMLGLVEYQRLWELPGFLREIVAAYPELIMPPGESTGGGKDGDGSAGGKLSGGGLEAGGSSTSSGGDILGTLKKMLGGKIPDVTPSDAERVSCTPQEYVGPPGKVNPPPAEAVRLANKLTVRFQTPKGRLSVPAPGRLDRIAALHQDPMPFRLDLPSRFSDQPSPKVVLHVDHSGSMGKAKWDHALLAAQAIALAIRRAAGDVRVTLFEGNYHHAPNYSADVLFCGYFANLSMKEADGNNTSFAWLPVVWMQFPDHIHILLTDGEGDLPFLVSERDRKRTFAIVIPDGKPEQIAPVAAKVVVVQDLDRLSGVFAFLAPRQWVA
jgi:hypothetical protein